MNSRQIEYFLAVAGELNFTKAAERLYVSQTAVSKQIRNLEEQLGVKLFTRSRQHVELTHAGIVFQREAQYLMVHYQDVVKRTRLAAEGMYGTLSVGFATGMGSTVVSSGIRGFKEKYPNIEMSFVNGTPSRLLQELKSRQIDLALIPLFDHKYYEGLSYVRIREYGMQVAMPKSHPLASRRHIDREDLENEPLILVCTKESELGEDSRILDPFIQKGIQVQVVDKNEDIETIRFMLAANMGLTILPEYLHVADDRQNGLVEIPFGGPADRIMLIAAYLPDSGNPSIPRILPFLENA
ncbi:MAG: LysR family transcriptional regulator [Lachnospiraceae bacterium]|jgi:DNA-binding transcriptional LysR family regulator|uniref:LysR family transcriptional regulator n=1 Tax=Clostridium sp. (strain SY8519) TaxID=1042156 RepID=UPI0002171A6A|nr:LysR family transcriptional regulator [Clostridium sp. SY8519]MCI1655230.1 LysR family transcriptional regulator [Lachnospiraceae bacterium]MCI1656420.1 LysR family transcriptional regulator [Lachnospiraceae bacterium]MCI2194902.1 LysR family transcriptional regulator [Lachnospiraceae bacterium]BAK47515.1 hypothetical protein CXIVA_15490 [Clostridium sp. SY8519]HAD19425.1 LysR family transcriptional regulator [Lachnospiraceae bacterium]